VGTRSDADSFLVAVQDHNLGRASNCMHEDFARDWTLGELAQVCRMSRSVFAERFKQMVGVPPMVYLAQWRMLKARDLLIGTELPMAEISERVGYASEFAFAKAFKKVLGRPPGALRRRQAPA
jgi:AraC-like DNA-binding protein